MLSIQKSRLLKWIGLILGITFNLCSSYAFDHSSNDDESSFAYQLNAAHDPLYSNPDEAGGLVSERSGDAATSYELQDHSQNSYSQLLKDAELDQLVLNIEKNITFTEGNTDILHLECFYGILNTLTLQGTLNQERSNIDQKQSQKELKRRPSFQDSPPSNKQQDELALPSSSTSGQREKKTYKRNLQPTLKGLSPSVWSTKKVYSKEYLQSMSDKDILETYSESTYEVDAVGCSLLHAAITFSDTDCLKRILTLHKGHKNRILSLIDASGVTPLEKAIEMQHPEIIDLLFSYYMPEPNS